MVFLPVIYSVVMASVTLPCYLVLNTLSDCGFEVYCKFGKDVALMVWVAMVKQVFVSLWLTFFFVVYFYDMVSIVNKHKL